MTPSLRAWSLALALAASLPWLGCIEKTELPADDDDSAASDDDDDDDIVSPGLAIQSPLPGAALFEFYSAWLQPAGAAEEPLTWYVVAGDLPDGLSVEADGWVHGNPTVEGSFEFEAYLQDSAGGQGHGPVRLDVHVDHDHLFAGVWFAEVDGLCADLGFLCFPWVRVEGAGDPQSERQVHPALFHVGPDGEPQDGFGDDVLYTLINPSLVVWEWTPLEWPTGDGSTLIPEDLVVLEDGTMAGGELTGGGIIGYEHPVLGHGEATGYVVPPDWCPGFGC